MEQFYDPVADMEREKKPKKFVYIWSILGALALIIGFSVMFFGQRLIDFFSGRDYEPTAEMAQIIEHLELTDEADLVLRAVHPTIQSTEEFNQNCPNRDEEMSTLGCFSPTANRIFIYKVESNELTGIEESVLAHELLHAIYQRMNNIDRTGVNHELQSYYNHHPELFGDYLASYSDEQYYTELHSVIGQRVKSSEMPRLLRDHYVKYFKNQDQIAEYYRQYRAVFDELKTNIEKLSTEVEATRAEINEKREAYQAHLDEYNQLSQEVRKNIEKGVYKDNKSVQAQYNRISELYEQTEAERLKLNEDINAFNETVAELNAYIERNNALNRIINSHADTKTEGTPEASN